MTNYYKYLPVGPEDKAWGLSVLNTGCTHIAAGSDYPSAKHPSHHNFSWEKGRVLDEYQLIYITRGGGIFESENSGSSVIAEGSMIMLFPGEKHRYRPGAETGWDEFWVGFNGRIIDNLVARRFFGKKTPVLHVGFDNALLNLFFDVIDKTREEPPGYHPLISGIVMHMLGHIHSVSKQDEFGGQDTAGIVNKARVLFRSNITTDISPAAVAAELQIGYARFRKLFKEYTGLAPRQFQIQLKIDRAKTLLMNPSKTIKEVAYELNFESNFYFSRLFKEKTGMTPAAFRTNAQKKYRNG